MNDFIFKRANESDVEFKIRLCKAKLNGDLGSEYSWSVLVDILKENCSADHLRKTAYGLVEASEYYDNLINEIKLRDVTESGREQVLEEFEEKKKELFKERVKLQDARREARNVDRLEARMEMLLEELKLAVESLPPIVFKEKPKNVLTNKDKIGIAMCSDWHIGAEIDNPINQFNLDIAKQRILEFANDIITYGKQNNLNKIIVANLGDMINGHIHVSTRVQSEIDVVQQTKMCAEMLAELIGMIANEFNEVEVVNVMGNHGRTTKKKEEAVLNENFEKFIPWYMELRLSNFNNIKMINDEKGLVHMDILGHDVAFVHGNFERANSPQNLSEAYGILFNYVFLGHFHHLEHKDVGINTETMINRCLNGTDDYALNIRKTSKAGQRFIIMTEKGITQTYDTIF